MQIKGPLMTARPLFFYLNIFFIFLDNSNNILNFAH